MKLVSINAVLRRLSRSMDSTTRDWMTILGGDVVRLALGFIASVLIARALDPAAYGVYVVLGTVTGIVGATADFGLSTSAVKRIAAVWQDDQILSQIRASVFFYVRVAAAALVVFPLLLLSGFLSPLLGLPAMTGAAPATVLLALALLGVPASAMSGAISTILQAIGQFKHVAAILVANTALTALLAIILWASDTLTIVSALLVLGIGPSLATFLIARRLLPVSWRLHLPTYRVIRQEAGASFRFGRWLWLANILAVLAVQSDVLLLNRLSAAEIVGSYGLALSLATKVDVVNRSLYTVLVPTVSALRQRRDYIRYVRRGLLRSALISLLILPAIFLARPLILFFYGPLFTPAVVLFQILLGAVVLDTFTMPLVLLAFPFNRPQWLASVDAIRLVVLVVTALLLIPVVGAKGAAIARIAARTFGILPILFLLGQRARHL